jgi:hypothetical protein
MCCLLMTSLSRLFAIHITITSSLNPLRDNTCQSVNIQVMDLCICLWSILNITLMLWLWRNIILTCAYCFALPFAILNQSILGSCNIKGATMEFLYMCIPCLVSTLYFYFKCHFWCFWLFIFFFTYLSFAIYIFCCSAITSLRVFV